MDRTSVSAAPVTTDLESTSTARWTNISALPAPALHLVFSIAFFPIYPLTLFASGEHYTTNYAISFELSPASADREKRIMREAATHKCRTVLGCSLTTLVICAKAYPHEYTHQTITQLFLLKVTLDSIQGLYLSFAVKSFVNSVTKSRCLSAFNHWTPHLREIASTLMAIPDAFLLGYFMLGAVGVLCYMWTPSASPMLDFLFSSGASLHEKLLSIIQSNTLSTSSPALDSRIIVCLLVIEFAQLMIIQYVLRWLQKKIKNTE